MQLRMAVLPLMVTASLMAAESPAPERSWPLWDGQETVEQYARRVNLPLTQTLDLGKGVKMELTLIPAGKFVMGTAKPEPVDEEGSGKNPVSGQPSWSDSGTNLIMVLAILGAVVIGAFMKKRWPQWSTGRYALAALVIGGCILIALHGRPSPKGQAKTRKEYEAELELYRVVSDDEKPAHAVTLTKPFYLGKFPVTQEQYTQVIGRNPSEFQGKDNPVEMVSWVDAQAFMQKVSAETRLAVRLPTEAEWEFACRAGTTTAYYSGDQDSDLDRVAWYSENGKSTTHPVGQKAANAFGVYDMLGNVSQWCQDWHGDDYYAKSPGTDPEGPAQGITRMFRGGCFSCISRDCRAASRQGVGPTLVAESLGFRVAAAVPKSP